MSRDYEKRLVTFHLENYLKDLFAREVEYTPEGNMSRWLKERIKEFLVERGCIDQRGKKIDED